MLLSALSADARAHDNTLPAHHNREQARTHTFSYASEVAAKEGSLAQSLYIRPLGEQWEVAQKDGTKEYSQGFAVPFAWADREIFVFVESVAGSYELYVNDTQVGGSSHGSTPFEFDITRQAKEGANTLKLVVGKDALSDAAPSLTGNVIIHAQPRIRIYDFEARTIFNTDDNGASVELGVTLKSHRLNSKQVRMHYTLLDPAGQHITNGRQDVDIDMRRAEVIRFLVPVPDAKPWSHERPDLYTLLVKLQYEGRYTEYVAYRFGMRNIEVKDGAMLLNGYEVPLSIVEYNAAATRDEAEAQLRKIKDAGFNAIKISRGPQPEFLYELCDRIGIYVCDQAAINTGWLGASITADNANPSNRPEYETMFVDRAVSMYRRSQSHPSVVIFSVAGDSPNGYNTYESYLALKKFEPNRPVIFLGADGEWNSDAVSAATAEKYPAAIGGRMVLDIAPAGTTSGKTKADTRPTEQLSTDGNKAAYHITNNASVTVLRGQLAYTVKQGSKVISEGSIPVVIEPGAAATLNLPLGTATKPAPQLKYEVSLRSNLN